MNPSYELYSLQPVRTPAEWAAYHSIRRESIFSLLLPGETYRESDPDEFKPGRLPHVLKHGNEIIGTVRIDLLDHARAGLRLIAIRRDMQRQGHGSMLLELCQRRVSDLGRTDLVINAHPSAVAFYVAQGYSEGTWQDTVPVPAGLIRVGKQVQTIKAQL